MNLPPVHNAWSIKWHRWLSGVTCLFRNYASHTRTDSDSCSYDSFTQANVVHLPLQWKWGRPGPEGDIPSVERFPSGFPSRVNKQKYFMELLPFVNCIIHRLTGFGKTAFLDQLAAFCDVYSEENFDDIRNEPFSAAIFCTKLQEHIDATVHRFLIKYTDQLQWVKRGLKVDQMSTPNVCLYAPLGTSHSTIITVDAYDTPFMNVSPEHVSQVKEAIQEILYYGVLSMFSGFGVHLATLECIFVMGIGIQGRDDLTPEGFVNIVDISSYADSAKMAGFTQEEITDLVEKWVAADKRECLLSEILKICWHERFTKGGENVYSCREVMCMIAANM
ncbi:hypothetical protein GYMLUDRAFT_250945 [Collybiopsis luxurians FD-317 M1]|uniref:AAA-ATPase-like domain-containing protein n=1 Tax=Collybiopsis luxurians FD-317 M1 TaxID=944289 RepID=A0A0D0CCY7_9AGAR|nr:hypothetical protein GYMLUDRAFT_250945 [Collybiopsis luxurians FD-317 M1]